MKAVSAGLQTVIDSGEVQWVYIYKLKLANGDIMTYSEHDQELDVDLGDGDGLVTYEPGIITEISDPDRSIGTSVDNADFKGAMTLINVFGVSKDDLNSGRFDGAELTTAVCHWPDPTLGGMFMDFGNTGDTSTIENTFEISTRSLMDRFDARPTIKIQPECRWDFGSAECGYDLTGQVHTGEITATTDARRYVTDIIQAAGYFDYGIVQFTSGRNQDVTYDINSSDAAGEIELLVPPNMPVANGDLITCTRGCKKDKAACVAFSNFINFGGFPDVPGGKIRNQRGSK